MYNSVWFKHLVWCPNLYPNCFVCRRGYEHQHEGGICTIVYGSNISYDALISIPIVSFVGVGMSINMKELEMIASNPQSTHLFMVDDLDGLNMLGGMLSSRICPGTELSHPELDRELVNIIVWFICSVTSVICKAISIHWTDPVLVSCHRKQRSESTTLWLVSELLWISNLILRPDPWKCQYL